MIFRADLTTVGFVRRLRLGARGAALACALWAGIAGCGTTQNRTATEQLLTSDAVDRAVARIDFRPLSGQKVYLDVEYVRPVKGVGSVNAEYVISSLRQQVLAAGCQLQDGKSLADYVIEPRVGALGLDGSEVVYGIPASNALGLATAIVPVAPTVPTIPELALAKKHAQVGAAKIGVFAYHRVTREVVWQSGLSQTMSNAKDSWMLGIGPFQSGTIYEGTRFAGTEIGLHHSGLPEEELPADRRYSEARVYRRPAEIQVAQPAPPASASAAAAGSAIASPALDVRSSSVIVPAGGVAPSGPFERGAADAEIPAEFLPSDAIRESRPPAPFPEGPASPLPRP